MKRIVKINLNIYKGMLAILFSVFTIFGYSYSKQNNWDLIFGSIIKKISFIVFVFDKLLNLLKL